MQINLYKSLPIFYKSYFEVRYYDNVYLVYMKENFPFDYLAFESSLFANVQSTDLIDHICNHGLLII